MENQVKRYFFNYGWLQPLSEVEYLNNFLQWVYEDCDEEDGTIVCRNEYTGELRYVIEEGEDFDVEDF